MHFKENPRFIETIAAFDALNAQDPNRVEFEGKPMPKELHDAYAMTRWVEALDPEASEAVHLAARCQHLCRWEVPRSSYPEGRGGYLKWRSDLKKWHAQKSAEILGAHAYDSTMIEAVSTINLKEGLKSNYEVQLIEDALCLVFLETQFESYLDQWDEAKVIRILQKTWAKMSARGHAAALKLKLSDRASRLVQQALS
ncbi:DUF4202 domain-containing protein [Coraliomargarita algicola]|uniref:DUF4202 domain-containing protein n=1 Tax=Coraliomargarita algicola TaxID=3092156 RepID=A0ABZ0RKY4_9BACT|nr:DUF4202 domain-containing protein [Coraliomargarita sp. J2-16]WPJ95811.1 DUF4202 domain-containing protein [Coraliomargarita sp. J2-16]